MPSWNSSKTHLGHLRKRGVEPLLGVGPRPRSKCSTGTTGTSPSVGKVIRYTDQPLRCSPHERPSAPISRLPFPQLELMRIRMASVSPPRGHCDRSLRTASLFHGHGENTILLGQISMLGLLRCAQVGPLRRQFFFDQADSGARLSLPSALPLRLTPRLPSFTSQS